jgi:hypothetical protein
MLWVMLVMTLCDKVCQWLSCKLKVTMLLTSPKIKIGWRKQCCIRLKNIWKSILIRLIDILEINANCSTLYFRYIMASILIWNSSVYYDVVDNYDFLRVRRGMEDLRGRDRMAVGFTIVYAISAYHHWCCEFESRSGRSVQHYVIKLSVICNRSVVFTRSLVSSTNKTDRHDIAEILLKVTLNTIKLSQTNNIEGNKAKMYEITSMQHFCVS